MLTVSQCVRGPGELEAGISLLRHQLCDVTLACEDGEPVQAHKLLLAAGSARLSSLLCSAPPGPLCLLLPGLTAAQLQLCLAFLYHGQVGPA